MQKADSVGKKLSQEEKELENLKTECNDVNTKIQTLHAETESMSALVQNFTPTQAFLFISNLFTQKLCISDCLLMKFVQKTTLFY